MCIRHMIENLRSFMYNGYNKLPVINNCNKQPSPSYEFRIVPIAFPHQKP